MKSFGDWLQKLGFLGGLLGIGIIAISSGTAWSASVPVDSGSFQHDSEGDGATSESYQVRPNNHNICRGGFSEKPLIQKDKFEVKTRPSTCFITGKQSDVISEAVGVSTLSIPEAIELTRSPNNMSSAPVDLEVVESISSSASDLLTTPAPLDERKSNSIEPNSTPTKGGANSEETQLSQQLTPTSPTETDGELDLSPEIIQDSPLLQRWLRQVPNVLEEIRKDPGFRTRLRLGYSQFPSTDDAGGVNVGVEDVFIGQTGLTVSGEYQAAFNGDRTAYGADLRYYVRPLGSYINVAPVVGYRHIKTDGYSTDGVNLGLRLLLVLSRGGGADISLTQSFVSPGSNDEVGLTTLSVGYAFTQNLRLSTDIQKQNSIQDKDSRVGIVLEWMP